MVSARGWPALFAAVWLAMFASTGAVAHPTGSERHNSMGSCGAFGEAVAEAVWQWCYKNEQDRMNGCKASFRSWVRKVERTCAQRRRELGCSPADYDAVKWHEHGWKQPGQELSVDRAVQYCDEDKPGQAAGPGPGGAPPALDRETRVRVQRALAAQGFDPGHPDGAFGPRTRGAIRSWQQATGHAASGELTGGQVEQLLSAAGSPGSAPGDLHGSIAFSQLDGGGYAFGIAWNAQGREAARRSAVEECGRRGGGAGCSEAGWFRNACGAIAIGDRNGYGTGWGTTNGEAESSALSKCRAANRDCRVAMSRCVDGQYKTHQTAVPKPAGPMCAEAAEGAKCWKELANKPGCYVWDTYFIPDQRVTWSGACAEGVVTGSGTLVWAEGGNSGKYTGTMVNGRMHGRGTATFASGNRFEGLWRNGKPNGHGSYTLTNGNRFEGLWRDGCFQQYGRQAWSFTSKEACGFK